MKKILFSAVSALALASFAADSTQFGVLRVPSSMKKTIVSVPWMESTTSVSDVTVSNLVLTSGLEVNDQLFYYNGGEFTGWVIASNETTHVKYWAPANNATENGITISGASSDVTIPRGGAVILNRVGGKNDRDLTGGFCIMGKPASGTATNDLTNSGFSLVAPTSITTDGETVQPVKISSLKWTKLNSLTDFLYVFTNATSLVTYRYINEAWYNVRTGALTDSDVIPAGTGAWFYSSKEITGRSVEL